VSTWAKQFALVFFVGFVGLALALGYSLMGTGALLSTDPFLITLRNAGLSFMAAGMALWVFTRREETGKKVLAPLFTLLTVGGCLLSILSLIFPPSGSLGTTPSVGGLVLNIAAMVIGVLAMIIDPAYPEPLTISWPEGGELESTNHAHGDHAGAEKPAIQTDDLAQIEGIGPEIRRILFNAGIHTFAGLSERTPEELLTIVRAANFQAPVNTQSWPEQARLAAEGDWEALDILREDLAGGQA
jgi:hypothetical protein